MEGFSCKSFFRHLVDHSPLRKSVFSSLWRIKILRKVKFFTWQVIYGRSNIMDQFARKLLLVGPFCCILRWKMEEDLDHILWTCEFVTSGWNHFFQAFGFSLVQQRILVI